MAAEEARAGSGEDGEDVENTMDKREMDNQELLRACMRNDTEEAMRLLEKGADPCFEDDRQWSPLIWAASHGNEVLTRFLLQKGAADVYRYDESQGQVRKKKHSPLHWAAFKGHVKVLWLLMAPPHSLSHHEKDAIGNTALHQAAAGGSLECTKCLMAQGVDVFARNDRGHTPFALCTMPEVQELLNKAMSQTACKATGKQFSSTVLRYLCSSSLDLFCESAVTQMHVYEDPESEEKEKPVTWCTEVKNIVQEAEHQLDRAMHLNQLDTITAALAAAEGKPVDCQLVHKCGLRKAKLESEIQLTEAMQVQVVEKLEEFNETHQALSQAIDNAEMKQADADRVEAAKALRRKLLSEASLIRALEGLQKTTVGHITMVEELTSAARGDGANEELLAKATRLIAKLKSEREVQHRIAETAPLCEISSWKEAGAKENLPPWSQETTQFEDFHLAYKSVVETADKDEIDRELMQSAVTQLQAMELLLIEKKQAEEEMKLKAGKKKGKKK
ncbi:unnamed protein product [Prorocentrum cordatum]|uniref:Uncharacterized protein n=1 Tax=Prorocentrum cordatum TaxID=2364126 RepID=A0ABN9QL71_9DINO|nr:unnamed protein product [Polarella glacialis]CAK0806841.1 unnamed protein product [Polarella glacialis]|mmetsp:Transcript_85228/g.222387  ORF Transcript_85228/g.222387 Transcript_85228/m.222387 type:complete len:504 (-) Transcript_85228:128-1639(-)